MLPSHANLNFALTGTSYHTGRLVRLRRTRRESLDRQLANDGQEWPASESAPHGRWRSAAMDIAYAGDHLHLVVEPGEDRSGANVVEMSTNRIPWHNVLSPGAQNSLCQPLASSAHCPHSSAFQRKAA